ncbi:MAG: adenylyl-sulfate kinase [Candidatus Parabeggiatoa sp. nov. 3]|nr:MAG: adenylyl-sulfate kinase [Gammaproteobacteria bacterium]
MDRPKEIMLTSPKVLWITGLSGAGKTTIARATQEILRSKGVCTVLLDGDQVRNVVRDETCGHDQANRLKNAYRISRLAKMIAEQGLVVIVATMSLFHEIHDWNRKNLPHYFEIYLKVDLAILQKRDPKGLYHKANRGKESNIVGVHLDIEEPQYPDLVIENNENLEDVSVIAELIVAH